MTYRRSPALGIRALLSLLATAAAAHPVHARAPDDPPSRIEQVIVSATRDPQAGFRLPLAWSRIDSDDLALTGAVHINQLMQRAPGAWISRGNGQESLTALRSPVLTGAGSCGAFYMAWDGISLRGPGFCNVNQLFDLNSEQAGAVEVIRGPGTAVYGANALHGVINALTADPRVGPAQRYAVEAGPNDYYRTQAELRGRNGRHAVGLYANATTDGGFKDDSGFDQQKLTLRHDFEGDTWRVTSAVEATNLNQETAGFIAGFESYRDPALKRSNPNPEAYRDSWSLRAYSRWTRDAGGYELSVTPYLRRADMEFLQHFLAWQPVEENGQEGVGLRISIADSSETFSWRSGIDIDATRGWLTEVQDNDFAPTLPAGVHYDFEVDALSLGAYAQADWRLGQRWNLDAGVRLEQNRYDYDNRTGDGSACAPGVENCRFFRPSDREDDFDNGSLSLGLSYALADTHRIYLRAANGFRPPQTAELYRLQSGQALADLDSETMTSIDMGLRGDVAGLSYDLSAYSMRKDDVIFQDADRQNVSGARTRHEGLEFSLSWAAPSGWYAGIDGNIARHRYASSANLLGTRLDINGNDIDTAPRTFGSARIGRRGDVLAGVALRAELEWVHMGSYYLDPQNEHEYEGHDLLNLRVTLTRASGIAAALRITNLLDEDFAERADFGFGEYRYFVGEPRGAYLEISWTPG